jgi:hypothetical protein
MSLADKIVLSIFAVAFECFMFWHAFRSAREAYFVIRGRDTDSRGGKLWFYRKTDGLLLVAKNRKQALVLTLGMAVLCFGFGLQPILILLSRHAR